MPSVDPRWIRGPADELAISEGCTFDEAAGRFTCGFVEKFCRQSKGRWAGQPLKLFDWQRDFLMRLFGWKRPGGTRRYRRAYLEVAKKNGKSCSVSALGLYLLLADKESAPEVYCNASDRDQASIVFDEAARMVRASPGLSARLEVIDSRKRIVDPRNNGRIQANSKEVGSKDGLNPSAVIFDELHRFRDRQLWDVFEYAGEAREQPLTISITTAGEDEEGVWHEQRDYSEKVNSGVIPDTAHLGVVYRADEADDIDDPATWRKANPSLGETIREDDFRRKLEEAKKVPIKLANFKRLRLNIIAREAAKFIDLPHWDACGGPIDADWLSGSPCWMGLDLSDVNDLTALTTIFGDPDSGFDVLVDFWLPEENIVALEHQHGVPYRTWAAQGLITLTPGNVVDYGFVRRAINDKARRYNLLQLAVDAYHAHKITQDLQEQDGIHVEPIRQGFLSLNSPTTELQRLVSGRRLRHGGHPILRWHASNAVAVQDDAGNIKLSKRKSKKKIDGMAALVNALAVATSGDGGGSSVYEARGIIMA